MFVALLAFAVMLGLPGAFLYFFGPWACIAAALVVRALWSPIMVNFDYDYSQGRPILPTGVQLIASAAATLIYVVLGVIVLVFF